jgi:hypothetical protein
VRLSPGGHVLPTRVPRNFLLIEGIDSIYHLEPNTDEDMVPVFVEDVDGTPLANTHFLSRRNWCNIVVGDGDSYGGKRSSGNLTSGS